MAESTNGVPKTLLHQLIQQRNWTYVAAAREFELAATRLGLDATMTERHIGRLARAERVKSAPGPDTRRVLADLFGRPADDLLAPPPAGSVQVATNPHAGARGELDMAAERARAFGERARSGLSDEGMEQIYDEVRSLALDYPQRPLLELLPGLVNLQSDLFDLLDQRQRPSHLRTLYFLAGTTSGLLAKSSHDLGRPQSAHTQARTATLCAEQADHYGLRAWINGLQSQVSYWSGRPRDAVRYAQRGSDYAKRAGSTVAAWLPASEARAWAALGRPEETRAAIERAEAAQDAAQPDDLDELGGLCTFGSTRRLYYAADALAWLPDEATHTERYGQDAVQAYGERSEDWAFGDEAGAQSDLAIARLHRGEIEGASDAIRPVLELPPDRRIHGIVSSLQRVQDALRATGASSPEAVGLQDEIEDFSRSPLPAAVDQ